MSVDGEDADPHYPLESILVHEFGHTVMNVGLDDAQRAQVLSCYDAAVSCSRVVRESYMGSNADEYWAEGVQAWFQASARADVNEGMLTRAQLRRYDPALAALLAAAFGEPASTPPYNFTVDELPPPMRTVWMRRQATYLLMRHLLLTSADALADVLERLVRVRVS